MTASIIHDTPDNPIPPGTTAGYLVTRDNKKLRYAIFRANITRAKGTIVLLQGRNETIEKYYETIRDLTNAGLWVATFDWRGQGGSERLLPNSDHGYVEHFADYEKDLEQFLEEVVLPDARLPFYIVAHSTGSLIALSAAPRLANRIERMALVSPFIAVHEKRFSRRTMHRGLWLANQLGLGRVSPTGSKPTNVEFETNVLTSDRHRFFRNRAIFETYTHLALGNPTVRWLLENSRAMNRVNDPHHLASIRIPTMLLGAGADAIVPIAALEKMASRFRASELISIDYARHEMLQEADIYRQQVLAAITAFIPGET